MKISDMDSLSSVNFNVKASTAPEMVEVVSTQRLADTAVIDAETADEQRDVIDDEMLEKAVAQANKSLEGYNRYIERSVHEKTKAIMYVMKDSKTDEVIREFPPKKIQDMIAKMWELAGLFIDERA